MGVDSVEDKEGRLMVSIYPNPATSRVFMEVDEKLLGEMISIKDVSGREVMQLQVNNTRSTIDISHLTSGIYFFSTTSLSETLRLSIQ